MGKIRQFIDRILCKFMPVPGHTYSWRAERRVCRCDICHPKPVAFISNPVIEHFDWLKHYGPHWQPDSLAFWLEPDTEVQLVSWFAEYRPGDYGVKVVGTLKVELLPPVKYGVNIDPWVQQYNADLIARVNAANAPLLAQQQIYQNQMAQNQLNAAQQNLYSQQHSGTGHNQMNIGSLLGQIAGTKLF